MKLTYEDACAGLAAVPQVPMSRAQCVRRVVPHRALAVRSSSASVAGIHWWPRSVGPQV